MRFQQLARMLGGELVTGQNAEKTFTGVSIDTRTLKRGELFFALRGERHDGHDFAAKAVENGAAGIVVERTFPAMMDFAARTVVVAVENSHEAMMALAVKYRDEVKAVYLAITGSNGKTTTKELTYDLLAAVTTHVYRSPGNFNNLYGLPLALFALPSRTRVAVMELGISVPGEMTRLAAIVRPDAVVITNVGPTHLETLGSVEGVARAKLELVRASKPGIPVIINSDNEILVRETKKLRKDFITFGLKEKADFMPQAVEALDGRGTVVKIEGSTFRLPLFGRYQVHNFLAAYAAVRTLGYDFAKIATEKILFETAPMRGQFVEYHGVMFIADCYNANPESVIAGLKSFAAQETGRRRVIVLGDMLELGENEETYHRQIGRRLSEQEFDLAVLVGPRSKYTLEELLRAGKNTDRVMHFSSAVACAEAMRRIFRKNDLAYIKGSRGMGLEIVIDTFRDRGEET
ncbi:MAG: UDP-N-acetylmuramoyl-tripeptide--D-alanyl-D-alanine ligase [Candidatus Zixiibacteriota bacterium]